MKAARFTEFRTPSVHCARLSTSPNGAELTALQGAVTRRGDCITDSKTGEQTDVPTDSILLPEQNTMGFKRPYGPGTGPLSRGGVGQLQPTSAATPTNRVGF